MLSSPYPGVGSVRLGKSLLAAVVLFGVGGTFNLREFVKVTAKDDDESAWQTSASEGTLESFSMVWMMACNSSAIEGQRLCSGTSDHSVCSLAVVVTFDVGA